jgi:predicted DNA-binding antitoxin AbrB/MazE fold protein
LLATLCPKPLKLVVGGEITGAAAMMVPAKYENGVFRPLEIVQMKEGTVVEVLVPAEREPSGKRGSIRDLFTACGRTAPTSVMA